VGICGALEKKKSRDTRKEHKSIPAFLGQRPLRLLLWRIGTNDKHLIDAEFPEPYKTPSSGMVS
jgi:hypothetical protein